MQAVKPLNLFFFRNQRCTTFSTEFLAWAYMMAAGGANGFQKGSAAITAELVLGSDETMAAGAGRAGKGGVFIQNPVKCHAAGRCEDLNDIFRANFLYGTIKKGEIFNFDVITEKIVKVIVC